MGQRVVREIGCVHTHMCVASDLECAVSQSAWLPSATTGQQQKRNGHHTEIAYRLKASVQKGLRMQPAANPRQEPA